MRRKKYDIVLKDLFLVKMMNRKLILISILCLGFLTQCATGTPMPEESVNTAEPVSNPAATSPSSVAQEPGSTSYPQDNPPAAATSSGPAINPLTGLIIENSDLLKRRPVLVKIENLPRDSRPQWGLSLADLIYEYHTEEGTTRFAAVFYGQNSEKIGPIRSGRMFDVQLVQMYKSLFIFGSAYQTVFETFQQHDFSDRLIVEGPYTSPALFRYEPQGKNVLLLNMNELDAVLEFFEIDNSRQNLDGMTFDAEPPAGGLPAGQVYVRFSSAIYNRWDYDAESGRYLRYVDGENAYSPDQESYEPLTDRLTGEAISADTLVIVMAENFVVAANIYDINLTGSGKAFIARDGLIFDASWVRENPEDVLSLLKQDGSPFPFKPGQTWFEVMSAPTNVEKQDEAWRFTFNMPVEP